MKQAPAEPVPDPAEAREMTRGKFMRALGIGGGALLGAGMLAKLTSGAAPSAPTVTQMTDEEVKYPKATIGTLITPITTQANALTAIPAGTGVDGEWRAVDDAAGNISLQHKRNGAWGGVELAAGTVHRAGAHVQPVDIIISQAAGTTYAHTPGGIQISTGTAATVFTAVRDRADTHQIVVSPSATAYELNDFTLNVADQTWTLARGATIKLPDSVVDAHQYVFRITASGVELRGPGCIDGNRANNASTNTKGVRIDAGGAAATITDIVVDGVELKEIPAEDAIYITGNTTLGNRVKRVRVVNCHVHDCDRNAVTIIDAQTVIVANNNIHDVRVGVDLEPNTADESVDDVSITSNTIHDSDSGIHFAGNGVTINGNVISNMDNRGGSGGHGILFSSNSARVSISGNTIDTCVGHGIRNAFAVYAIVANNIIRGTGSNGITTRGRTQVLGNYIEDGGATAIEILDLGTAIITGNWMHKAGATMTTGINLTNTGNNKVSDNHGRLVSTYVANVSDSDELSRNGQDSTTFTQDQGGLRTHRERAWADISATATLTNYQRRVKATSGAGGITITLPSAATVKSGAQFIIKKVDSGAGAVTVSATGAETIDGAATYVLTAQYERVTLESDGTTWQVV